MLRIPDQLTLGLRVKTTWGGALRGAGQKPGANPRIAHLSRGVVRQHQPCHVTLRALVGVPNLRSISFVRAFESSLTRGCERRGFRVVHYSIQGNHAHFIVEADDRAALGRGMISLGTRFARAVRRAFGHRGRVLADRYHLHRLKTPSEVRNAIAYVLLNARKHLAERGARLPCATRPDPASSGRWFDGWMRSVQPSGSRENAPVANPRAWLVAVGWRRHGLIDPSAVPG